MSQELQVLVISAASIGFFHTLLGPDHYLPFIMIGKAKEWKLAKVLGLTVLCGIAHILSSVLVGFLGIALELQVEKLNWFESVRGNLAAWALIAFGLLYALWGIRRWYKKHNHSHTDKIENTKNVTPWVLFIIFALGPCEPLIPILMYPAAIESVGALVLVTSVFGLVTLVTMTGAVLAVTYGLSFVNLKRFENLGHPIAGFVIFLSGLAIQVLGL
jgi:sulfite exporter TauE/SafE